jgi:hypothetical protein
MGPPSYMQSVVDRNVVKRRIPVMIPGLYAPAILLHSPLTFCGLAPQITLHSSPNLPGCPASTSTI